MRELENWWISIPEAVARTGKHQSTIYRRCQQRKNDDDGSPIVLVAELVKLWKHTNTSLDFRIGEADATQDSHNHEARRARDANASHTSNVLEAKLEAALEKLDLVKEQLSKTEAKAEEDVHHLRAELHQANSERQREQIIRAKIEASRNELQQLVSLMNDRANRLSRADGLRLALFNKKPDLVLPAQSESIHDEEEVIDADTEEVAPTHQKAATQS